MEEKDKQTIIDELKNLLTLMGVEADVETKFLEDVTVFNVKTEDSGILIGQHGTTLKALQYMLRILVYNKLSQPYHIVVDVEDYKKNREDFLRELAKQAADRVKETQKALLLKPMAAYERRIVHQVISELGDIETESRGEEPERRVVIRPV